MRPRFLFLSFLLLLLLCFPLSAQSVRDSVTIEVVDVPVFVTSNEKPVRGLTRDDFELYVNGKRQAIDYFDVTDSEEGAPQILRDRRLFLLVFDVAFSPPFALGRAQKAAGELIARAKPEDLFAVATFSLRRGLWFATPFTADRVALARGIGSLSSSESGDPLAIVITPHERASMAEWAAMNPDRNEEFFRDNIADRLGESAMADIYQMELRRAVEHQILDLKDLAGRLAALQGQKHVVLLSEGFDGQRASGRDALSNMRYGNISGGANAFRRIGLDTSSVFKDLKDMTAAFQSADIFLHALDLKGVHSLMGSDGLKVMVTHTGGKFVHNRNDLGDALVDLTDSLRHGYVLGFRPSGAKAKHNTIEVKVKNLGRGAQVKYRKGFSGSPRESEVQDGLYLADVVLNDVPQTGTPAELEVAEGNRLLVRVPLRPLAAQLGKSGTAELLVYIFGKDGVAMGFTRKTIDVIADASGQKSFSVPLPEGATVAKALLRVEDSLGFSRTDV